MPREKIEDKESAYRTETNAPAKAKIPPTIGKYMAFWLLFTKHPANKVRLAPKHMPGKSVGSITPSDIPTTAERIASNHRTTTAKFRPTGKNSGSRNA